MRLLTLIAICLWSLSSMAQSAFQIPTFSYDRTETEEGTTRYFAKDDLVAEVHKPYKGFIKYFCSGSNAIYDSV
ncbi:MAG: hypothetical protein AAGH79_13060, partial [Bacteroidota bacterium]